MQIEAHAGNRAWPENAMVALLKKRINEDRWRILGLVAGLIFLVVAAIALSRLVSAGMLRADALSTSTEWASNLIENSHELPEILAGIEPSSAAQQLFQDSVQSGEVFRFRVWDLNDHLLFASERVATTSGIKPPFATFGAQARANVATGKPWIAAMGLHENVQIPEYAQIYYPLTFNGAVRGVLELHFDEGVNLDFYEHYTLLSTVLMAIAVLLAGGLPMWGMYLRMLRHREAEEKARYLAAHDPLTGVANRAHLATSAKTILSLTKRTGRKAAVLLLDLDRFKEINDGFGHALGDKILQQFAERIRGAIRAEDLVARLGGDEFIIVQVGIDKPADAADLADRLMQVFSEPYLLGNTRISCGSSIGVAITPDDALEWDALMRMADAALYKAKEEGRNTVCYFQPGMDAILHRRRMIEADLRKALGSKAFTLAYQPIYSFEGRKLLAFEALMRWPASWDPMSPAEFIPVAEESGLIVPIGAWVLEEATRTAVSWETPVKVSVNLSPVQFRVGSIVETVRKALTKSGLPPERLELEVTESLWLQNTESVLRQLGELRQMGVAVALDDFGIGYSSLSYLWKFAFDRVKIDRSFINEMERDKKAAAIVNTIVALGRSLELTVTAEGVENEIQATALSAAGCDQVQGFFFGRPLSVEDAAALAKS